MFDNLFCNSRVLSCQRNAPHAENRERFLAHCHQQGYARTSLRKMAQRLLSVVREINTHPPRKITLKQIGEAADRMRRKRSPWRRTSGSDRPRKYFIRVAVMWFRFIGLLREPLRKSCPFGALVQDFDSWMAVERGLTSATVETQCRRVERFLWWYKARRRPFRKVHTKDIDAFLVECGRKGWSRRSIAHCASALRTFFRFSGTRGRCSPLIAEGIIGPRIYAQEDLPSGPTWEHVERLLANMDTSRPCDIRDRAIVMLFALYGLRSSEVSKLRLEDIDWEHDQILVRRPKQRRSQKFPLISSMGHAILRYLRLVRPRSSHRELFLTLAVPFRPISRAGLYHTVGDRMAHIDTHSVHRGPHSLRHACATHLLTQGLSLKEIADHLGHRSLYSTQIYAKVDLPGLREVAEFDMGGLS